MASTIGGVPASKRDGGGEGFIEDHTFDHLTATAPGWHIGSTSALPYKAPMPVGLAFMRRKR